MREYVGMFGWVQRKIKSEIMAAVQATDRSTQVFYITGEGGEGKTVLLRQIGLELESPDGASPAFRWSGILDLYHPNVNTNSGLETQLSESLEKAGEFQDFRDARGDFVALRDAGLPYGELEEYRLGMAQIFAKCLNTVTDDYRMVIALDTTERIQYEFDEVQKICGLTEESTTVKTWLLEQLEQWQNCVVLLAGRTEAANYLEAALREQLASNPDVDYRHLTLNGFDKDETEQFIAQQDSDVQEFIEEKQLLEPLWQTTEGRPIRLALAVEVIRNQIGIDRLVQIIKNSPPEKARREIDKTLIEMVMGGEPDPSLRQILRYLAVARRGLDVKLLQTLAGSWNYDTCQEYLEAIADRSFVKVRPEDGRYFLHDEMFDLCDNYLLRPDEIQMLSARVVDFYEERIKTIKGKKSDAESIIRNYQVDALLYRLRAQPRDGYEWYAREAEYAIRAAEVGYDMRLRNELLAFLRSSSVADGQILPESDSLRQEIRCDGAARWVKRYMIRGQNDTAVQVAETIRSQPADIAICPPEEPPFGTARADLEVYYAQALIYTGKVNQAVRLLKSAIQDLEAGQKPEEVAKSDANTYAGWRRNMVLGRGHNNLGYAYWRRGNYGLALTEFRAALPYFRASGLLEEAANTDDNMGRVFALLYDQTTAESLVEDGLVIRRELGRSYRQALSQISRAIIHITFGQPHRARPVAEAALTTCESIDAHRGVGLASIVLGHALRDIGSLWHDNTYSVEQAKGLLSDAAKHLKTAINVFQEVNEPERLMEACNELGCVYREQASLAAMEDEPHLARHVSQNAIKQLQDSLEMAEKHQFAAAYVDTCEDLAQVYYQRGDLKGALVWLDKAEAFINDIYKIQEDVGLQVVPVEECIEEFWQQLGKIELLKGHIAYEQDKGMEVSRSILKTAVQHYLFAIAYFERFSEENPGLNVTLRQLYERFKRLDIEELQYIQEGLLPEIAARYKIDASRMHKFLEDTMGLVR